MDDLHPEALVVRGGRVRDVETLMEKVQDAVDDGDGPVVSVFCDVSRTDDNPGLSLHDLCKLSDVVHGSVQVSSVRRLRAANFELVHDVSDGQAETHHHVTFREPLEQSELGLFINCFDEVIPNPTGGKRRSR